ncbi:MAG: hypothetical protein Q4D48_10030, partial [Coriobacteriales bacterium]|nr:hypothetical protein [Coriobacteriales bacterium]
MNLHEELIERLARRRSHQLGNLSPAAYAELVLSVREQPEAYVDHDADQAFMQLVAAVDRVMRSREDDDLRDDDAFMEERSNRMARLLHDCEQALAVCPESVHARLLAVLASDKEPDDQLDALLALQRDITPLQEPLEQTDVGDAWLNVFTRGRLRVLA